MDPELIFVKLSWEYLSPPDGHFLCCSGVLEERAEPAKLWISLVRQHLVSYESSRYHVGNN